MKRLAESGSSPPTRHRRAALDREVARMVAANEVERRRIAIEEDLVDQPASSARRAGLARGAEHHPSGRPGGATGLVPTCSRTTGAHAYARFCSSCRVGFFCGSSPSHFMRAGPDSSRLDLRVGVSTRKCAAAKLRGWPATTFATRNSAIPFPLGWTGCLAAVLPSIWKGEQIMKHNRLATAGP